jgi:HK97 family phage prohead protease
MRWPWKSKHPRKQFTADPRPIDQMFADMLRATAGGGRVSRAEALTVPAVLRGRNLICSIATLPLVQRGPDKTIVDNPLFVQHDPDVPNIVTLSQTIEDLLFEAIAWWRVRSRGWDKYPSEIRRVDPGVVSLQPPGDGRSRAPLPAGIDPRDAIVWVDGKPVQARDMIRFDSPNPALLIACGPAIRRAILLDRAAGMYADDPRPLDYFTPTDGADPVGDDDIADILNTWKAARRTRSTGYVPAALTYHTVEQPTPADLQLVELQKQASLEIANGLGIDPEDVGISTTSRTYANAVDRRRDRINDVLSPYMRAITDRLSMGDVTRRGHYTQLVLDDYLKSNPTERWATYTAAKALDAISKEEIRDFEGWPRLSEGDTDPDPVPEPMPAAVDAHRPPALTFDAPPARMTFDFVDTTFAADRDQRIVEGILMPYGQVTTKYGLRLRFARGSLLWSDPARVKLFRDHDTSNPLGRALTLKNTPAGLHARFQVITGPDGDKVLDLAQQGVLDGFSPGVDFDLAADTVPDPRERGVTLVRRADLREGSLTAIPAYDDARVTSVRASRQEPTMPCELCGQTHPAGTPCVTNPPPANPPANPPPPAAPPTPMAATFSADQFQALMAQLNPPPPADVDGPTVVDPTGPGPATVTAEALPYRFDRRGNFAPVGSGDHVFSADLHEMALSRDTYGQTTDAGKRVMALIRATFDTDTADVNELNPAINRPDLYVDQQDYKYPIWAAISKGAPPNGVQPFGFPKFSSATGLVADHTEGTEPTAGTFVTTSQTITPTPVSGKASLTREVWDMGGNPAVSTLIFQQMLRGWREALESAAATFLNTLVAATDITLTAGAVDEALAADWDAALAELAFARGYDYSAFVVEKVLYKAFVAARDTAGRVLYPMIAPQNANGTAAVRFRTLDLGGVTGMPSWALASTAGDPNNSWLFDPMFVHGWASAPQRLEFPGTDAAGAYAPVAMVDLAIWGYKALANSDIGAVRQVIYDSVA